MAVEIAVRTASTLDLARALAGAHPFAVDDTPDPACGAVAYVRCPRCQAPGHRGALGAGPAAAVLDDGRLRCPSCSTTTTRWHLERLVLESANAIDTLRANLEGVA